MHTFQSYVRVSCRVSHVKSYSLRSVVPGVRSQLLDTKIHPSITHATVLIGTSLPCRNKLSSLPADFQQQQQHLPPCPAAIDCHHFQQKQHLPAHPAAIKDARVGGPGGTCASAQRLQVGETFPVCTVPVCWRGWDVAICWALGSYFKANPMA